MKKLIFLVMLGFLINFLGCAKAQPKKEVKKPVVSDKILYEEFKAKQAQEQLDKELR